MLLQADAPTNFLLSVPFYVYEELLWDNATVDGNSFLANRLRYRYRYAKHDDDYWFLQAALQHPLRTSEPKKAKLFVVPSLINQVKLYLVRGALCWKEMCGVELLNHTEKVLSSSPWFQRSKGKDHIIVNSHYRYRFPSSQWLQHYQTSDHIVDPRLWWHKLGESIVDTTSDIAHCNMIGFEDRKENIPERFHFPSFYIGQPCPLSTKKTHDFAMVARLENGRNSQLDKLFQSRRDICEWLGLHEDLYSISHCGQGDQCPALSDARLGFHVRGDTMGASRLMDTLLSGTVPIFTLQEQYNVLPNWIDWDKISYFVDVSNKTVFLSSIDTILRDTPKYKQKLIAVLENRALFDWHTHVPFDAYMYMLQCHLWPELRRNVTGQYSALISR